MFHKVQTASKPRFVSSKPSFVSFKPSLAPRQLWILQQWNWRGISRAILENPGIKSIVVSRRALGSRVSNPHQPDVPKSAPACCRLGVFVSVVLQTPQQPRGISWDAASAGTRLNSRARPAQLFFISSLIMPFLSKRSTVVQGTDGLGELRPFSTPPHPRLYKEMLQGKANI